MSMTVLMHEALLYVIRFTLRKYVVGPGSVLEDGGTYAELGDRKDAPLVHPDFDFDAWCENFAQIPLVTGRATVVGCPA
jgi:hypothetical protein